MQQRGLAVRDVAIRQAHPQYSRDRRAGLVQGLPYSRAEAAGKYALLDGHEQIVLGRQLGDESGVDGLGEAGVGDRHGDPLGA